MDGTAEVIAVIERLESVAESLRHVQSRYPDADLRLTLVAYVPTHERAAVPNLELDNHTLRRLADLGLTFEIDYMLLAPEEDAPTTDH